MTYDNHNPFVTEHVSPFTIGVNIVASVLIGLMIASVGFGIYVDRKAKAFQTELNATTERLHFFQLYEMDFQGWKEAEQENHYRDFVVIESDNVAMITSYDFKVHDFNVFDCRPKLCKDAHTSDMFAFTDGRDIIAIGDAALATDNVAIGYNAATMVETWQKKLPKQHK